MYLVKDNYMISANFICYTNDKNNHEPYGETFMAASSAICIARCTEAPEKRTSKKEKKIWRFPRTNSMLQSTYNLRVKINNKQIIIF